MEYNVEKRLCQFICRTFIGRLKGKVANMCWQFLDQSRPIINTTNMQKIHPFPLLRSQGISIRPELLNVILFGPKDCWHIITNTSWRVIDYHFDTCLGIWQLSSPDFVTLNRLQKISLILNFKSKFFIILGIDFAIFSVFLISKVYRTIA